MLAKQPRRMACITPPIHLRNPSAPSVVTWHLMQVGAHCLKYGMTSNHVLGIKVVLPDGEVIQLGGESQEFIGPDLVGFFVGSEGLFGIALEITLRLMPKPELYRTILAAYI